MRMSKYCGRCQGSRRVKDDKNWTDVYHAWILCPDCKGKDTGQEAGCKTCKFNDGCSYPEHPDGVCSAYTPNPKSQKIKCKNCFVKMTWAANKVQYGRLLKKGFTESAAKEIMPLCNKCTTSYCKGTGQEPDVAEFSNKKSVPFWAAVNRINDEADHDLIYKHGCKAQKIEHQIEQLQEELAEKDKEIVKLKEKAE